MPRAAEALSAAVGAVGPIDQAAMAAAATQLDRLTKPRRSLGRLEQLAIQLAGITGYPAPGSRPRTIVVAAADHGVAMRGVSAYPQSVTVQMVTNFLAGGAAINVLAQQVDAAVLVVDVGVASPIPRGRHDSERAVRFVSAPIRRGSSDISVGPAMSRSEALASIEVGLRIADAEASAGTRLIGLGEMGIANTTPASAIVAVMTGRPVAEITGRGTGIDDEGYARKVAAIERALAVNRPQADDPVGVLASVGGFEIGALVGLILGAAAARIPVILDGYITGAAAILAATLCPGLPDRLIAAHRSVEPGHLVVLQQLGLTPLLELDLRLGEGTGTALAMPLIDAACAIRDGMATFASAGIAGPGE
jgi:nicotinate-nucleotide--dimethylbenzimidazole phosphoribosyltransferase